MKKTLLLSLGLVACSAVPGTARAISGDSARVSLTPDTARFTPDSLRVTQLVTPFLEGEAAAEVIPNEPDELIQDRLSCLETTIPLTFNPTVRQFIDLFTIKKRKYTRRMLERENVYFPLFEEYLAKHNMPQELKYLAVVESGLNPKAVSRTKAMGLWQFMAPTANDFRLKQNQYIDERLDPEKSTEAACKFLKQLHNMFGDWQVALAAYNCGPGNVRKAIKRSGGKTDFWGLYPYLPLETRGYVPSFIALTYAMNYAPEHNLQPDTLRYAHQTDTLLINDYLCLERFSEQICVSREQLMELNPALKVPYIPGHFTNYPLRVPAHCSEFIAQNRGWLMDSCGKAAVKEPVLLAEAPVEVRTSKSGAKYTTKTKRTYHTVRKGEVLGRIADKHNVALSDLKKWNRIKGSSIMPGQKLVVMHTVKVPVKTAPDKVLTETQLASAKPAKTTAAPAEVKETAAVKVTPATKETAVAKETPAKETAVAKDASAAKETVLASAKETPAKEAAVKEVPAAKAVQAAKVTATVLTKSTDTEEPATASKTKEANETEHATAAVPTLEKPGVYHVQPGDTLFNISRRFEGLTVEQIKKLNNLKSNDIKVGQKLIIG